MTVRPSGCVFFGCVFALALLVAVPLYRLLASDETARRQAGLVLVAFALFAALWCVGGRRPKIETWKCTFCGEPNSEDNAGCPACGKHRE